MSIINQLNQQAQQNQPQAQAFKNPILAAMAKQKPFANSDNFPRCKARYVLEATELKITKSVAGIAAFVVVSAEQLDTPGDAISDAVGGGKVEKAAPVGSSIAIKETQMLDEKSGAMARYRGFLMALAGESDEQMGDDRMGQFILFESAPIPNFPNLGLGVRIECETWPGVSKGKKQPVTNKKFKTIELTPEELKRIDAKRATAGLRPLQEVW